MVSPRDYRLSSLTGFCVSFRANVPVFVPPHVYIEALEMGANVVDQPVSVAEAPVSVAKVDPTLRMAELDRAMTAVLARNDPEDFKADSTPKVNKVIAELAPEFEPRPTATEVFESYERMQENLDLVED
jgi:hypothetical protein